MRKGIVSIHLCIYFLIVTGITALSYADSAEVLPKGVSKLTALTSLYFPIDERFDPDGNTEDIAADFNTRLGGNVFPALSLVEEAFGLPVGSANIGDSVIDFEYKFTDFKITYQYGLTDRLTVGIKIPYYWNKTDVDARIDPTNANIGTNPFLGTPGDPFGGAPLIPIALGGVPLTTDQVQDLLVQQYGYKRIESWSDSGLSDIEVGFRYQYLKTDNWRLAFTGGVRLPTGDEDDPDNLIDTEFGEGAYALLFRLNNDYVGIKNLVLNATLRYDLKLPDKETLRVLYDANMPISPNKEKVDRDLGDLIEIEASGTYDFSERFSLSLLYRYGYRLKDDISGDMGFVYSALEDETDSTSHTFIGGICYSTIPMFKAKKFPLPLKASIEYENVFAGSNNFLKQQLFTISIDIFF